MDLKTSLLTEFTYEAFLTRRMLELIPFDKANWKPHEKSMKLQELALHIATIPTWVSRIITTQELNLATTTETNFLTSDEQESASGQTVQTVNLQNTSQLLALFDANTQQALADVEATTNEDLMQTWTMRDGKKVFFSLPRIAAIRNMAQNHTVHHRGQLGVYLRLQNIPLPSVYGSTADVMV
ncbi:DinB family protein [Xanthocytophaga agilis]|uniref:DinB family protein n=1 Tax=Xanthocytophaga agilis TaxID=3048010 RepID=A0AAE3UE02_9BACT|nr:DinB family protein [Xanthocytophaga agilis]MDJ1501750.1 DinB family protein [Xanthocytophaga agilis]